MPYQWLGWIRICEEHGMTRSMNAKGRSPNNAAAEGGFSRLKAMLFHCHDWKSMAYGQFRERLAAYLTHYNQTRIKKSLGGKAQCNTAEALDWPHNHPGNIRTPASPQQLPNRWIYNPTTPQPARMRKNNVLALNGLP